MQMSFQSTEYKFSIYTVLRVFFVILQFVEKIIVEKIISLLK